MSDSNIAVEPSVIKANPPSEVEVDITWEGKPAKVVIKRLSFGERNDVMRQAIGGKVRYMSEESTMIEVDPFLMREILLLKALKEAPFPKTMDGVRSLPADIADLLVQKAEEVNPFRGII